MYSLRNMMFTTIQPNEQGSTTERIFNKDKVLEILDNLVLHQAFSHQSAKFFQKGNTMMKIHEYFSTQLSKISSLIGMVLLQEGQKPPQIIGSGILISESLVLTCAHSLLNVRKDPKAVRDWKDDYQGSKSKLKMKLRFYISKPSEKGIFISSVDKRLFNTVEEVYICPQYLEANQKKDWSILKLKRPVNIKDAKNVRIVIPDEARGEYNIPDTYYLGHFSDEQIMGMSKRAQDGQSSIHPSLIKSQMNFFEYQGQLMINSKCVLGEDSSGGPLISIQYTKTKQFNLNIVGLHKSSELLYGKSTGCTFSKSLRSLVESLNDPTAIKFIDFAIFNKERNQFNSIARFDKVLSTDTTFKHLTQFLQKVHELAENYLFLEASIQIDKKKLSPQKLQRETAKTIQQVIKSAVPIPDLDYNLREYKIRKLPLKDFLIQSNSLGLKEEQLSLSYNQCLAILEKSLQAFFALVFGESIQPKMKDLGSCMSKFIEGSKSDTIYRLEALIRLLKELSLEELLVLFEQSNEFWSSTLPDLILRLKSRKKSDLRTRIFQRCNSLSRIDIFYNVITHKQQYETMSEMTDKFTEIQQKFKDILKNAVNDYKCKEKDLYLHSIIVSRCLRRFFDKVKSPKRYKFLMQRVIKGYYSVQLSKRSFIKAIDNTSIEEYITWLFEELEKQIEDTINSKLRQQIKWPQKRIGPLKMALKECVAQEVLSMCILCLDSANIMYRMPPLHQTPNKQLIQQEIKTNERKIIELKKKMVNKEHSLARRIQQLSEIQTRAPQNIINIHKQELQNLKASLKAERNEKKKLEDQFQWLWSEKLIQDNAIDAKFKKWESGPSFEEFIFASSQIRHNPTFSSSSKIKQAFKLTPTLPFCTESMSKDQTPTKYSELRQLKRGVDKDQHQIYYNFIGSILYKGQSRSQFEETGTGIKFGRGLVLTAYHTIQSYLELNRFVKGNLKFKIIGSRQKPQFIDVVRIKMSKQFDWAILYLQEFEKQQQNKHPFKVITFNRNDEPSFLVGKNYYCQIVGFLEGKKDVLFMSVARIFINQNYKSTIQYTNSTNNKMSGAAILIYPTGQYGPYLNQGKIQDRNSRCRPYILGIHLGGFNQEVLQGYTDKYYVQRYNFGIKILQSELQSIRTSKDPQHEITAFNSSNVIPYQIPSKQEQIYQQQLQKYLVHENSYQFSDYAYERSKSAFIENYYKTWKIPDLLVIQNFMLEIISHSRCDLFFAEIDFQNILSFSNSPTQFVNRLFNVKLRSITQPKDVKQYKRQWKETIQSSRQAIQKFYIRKQIAEYLNEDPFQPLQFSDTKKSTQKTAQKLILLERQLDLLKHIAQQEKNNLLKQKIQKYEYYLLRFNKIFDKLSQCSWENQQEKSQEQPRQLVATIKRFILLKKVREMQQKCKEKRVIFRQLYDGQKTQKAINRVIIKEKIPVDGLLFDNYTLLSHKNAPSSFGKFCRDYYCHEYNLYFQGESSLIRPQDQEAINFFKNALELLKSKILHEIQYQIYKFLLATIRVNIDEMAFAEKTAVKYMKSLLKISIKKCENLSLKEFCQKKSPQTYRNQLIKRAQRLSLIQRMQNLPKKELMVANLMNFKLIREQYLRQYKQDIKCYMSYIQKLGFRERLQQQTFFERQYTNIQSLTEYQVISLSADSLKYNQEQSCLLDLNRIILEESQLFHQLTTDHKKCSQLVFNQQYAQDCINFSLWKIVERRFDVIKYKLKRHKARYIEQEEEYGKFQPIIDDDIQQQLQDRFSSQDQQYESDDSDSSGSQNE